VGKQQGGDEREGDKRVAREKGKKQTQHNPKNSFL